MTAKYALLLAAALSAAGQTTHVHHEEGGVGSLPTLAQQVRRIENALEYLGQPLSAADQRRLNDAIALTDEAAAVREIQHTLDKLVLANVEINPEGRVKVEQGPAKPELVDSGTRLFLIKVSNQAKLRAALTVTSPNTGKVYVTSNGSSEPKMQLSAADARERRCGTSAYAVQPLTEYHPWLAPV